MKYVLYDFVYGNNYEILKKVIPEIKIEELSWKTNVGSKKHPVWEDWKEILAVLELNSLEELHAFILKHNNVQIRQPTEGFPYWRIWLDRQYGNFHQR